MKKVGESGQALAAVVQGFDDFTEENDPHGEHDFGKFSFLNVELFWKIDQYNTTYDRRIRRPGRSGENSPCVADHADARVLNSTRCLQVPGIFYVARNGSQVQRYIYSDKVFVG